MKKNLGFDDQVMFETYPPNAQAYPLAHDLDQILSSGLTRLEVFTCAVLQGLCSNAENVNIFDHRISKIANDAVKIATATIEHLNKAAK